MSASVKSIINFIHLQAAGFCLLSSLGPVGRLSNRLVAGNTFARRHRPLERGPGEGGLKLDSGGGPISAPPNDLAGRPET